MNSRGVRDHLPTLDPCPIANRHGEPCGAPSIEDMAFAICEVHAIRVFRYMSALMESLSDDPLFRAKIFLEDAEQQRARERRQLAERDEVVYYVQIGDHIKIGYTSVLRQRMNAYPATRRLLATEPGTYQDEQARHQQFRHHLAAGNEWFHPGQDLIKHINELRRGQGAEPIPDAA